MLYLFLKSLCQILRFFAYLQSLCENWIVINSVVIHADIIKYKKTKKVLLPESTQSESIDMHMLSQYQFRLIIWSKHKKMEVLNWTLQFYKVVILQLPPKRKYNLLKLIQYWMDTTQWPHPKLNNGIGMSC